MPDAVLTLNCGSSSIKFALFERGERRLLRGRIEDLGSEPHLQAWGLDGSWWSGQAGPQRMRAFSSRFCPGQ